MCGIVGYIGKRPATDILLDGLRRLEYRGYDSAGMAVVHDGDIRTAKSVGRVANLAQAVGQSRPSGTVGIAHTRWATHGVPSDENAHPHVDCQGGIAVVHNGIIENWETLRRGLESRGHVFRSQTDTEVLAHLIEEYASRLTLKDALAAALKDVIGTFGLALVSAAEPRRIYVARRGSPIVLGLGPKGDEFYVASDPSALVAYTRDVVYLDDDELAVLSDVGVETTTLDLVHREKPITKIDWTMEEIERGRFPHFMAKEIFEQPAVAANVVRGRLDAAGGRAVLGGLASVDERLRKIERITIIGCGSAAHAGLVGEYMIEEYAEVPVEVQLASEYRYRRTVLDPEKEAVVAVSQSGETADTLGALREAKARGALTLGIVNAVGSTVARETDAGVFIHAGPEIAVASTKAFLGQVIAFSLLSLHLGRQRRMSAQVGERLVAELHALPQKIEKILQQDAKIRALARKYSGYGGMLYLGRRYNAPVAAEGALKLKEIAYVHAEGYAAGEMKHGPIALLDRSFPVVALATKDGVYAKMRSNLEEVRARQAPILAVVSEGDEEVLRLADDVIAVPRTIEMLSPILNVIPLQLFAYHMAVARGLDPDKPRNLAKSVTVE